MSNLTLPNCFLILTFGLQISSIARSEAESPMSTTATTSPATIPGTDTPTSTTVTTTSPTTVPETDLPTSTTVSTTSPTTVPETDLPTSTTVSTTSPTTVPETDLPTSTTVSTPSPTTVPETDLPTSTTVTTTSPTTVPETDLPTSTTVTTTSPTTVPETDLPTSTTVTTSANSTLYILIGVTAITIFLLFLACCLVWINIKRTGLDLKALDNRQASSKVPDVAERYEILPAGKPIKIEIEEGDGLSNLKTVEAAQVLVESIANPAYVSAGPDEEPPYEIVSSSTKGQTSSTQDLSVADQTYAQPDAIDNKTNNKILADGGDSSVENPKSSDPNDEGNNTAANEVDVMYAKPVPKSERPPSQPFKIEGKDDDGLSNSKIVEAALFLGESIDNPADVSAGPDEEPPYEIVSSSTKGQTSSTQDLSVADQTYAEPDAIDNKTNNKILADGGDPSVESPNSTDPNDESTNTATNETDVIYAQPVPKSERCPSQKDTSRKEERELRRDGDSTDLKEEEEPRGDRTSIDLGDLASTMATFPSFGTRKLSLLFNEEEETTTL